MECTDIWKVTTQKQRKDKVKVMERIVKFTPAFDKRHADDNKNYGIHGVDMHMALKGKRGATQFTLFTNWHLPHVQKELDEKESNHEFCHPLPADVGYHSLTPQYEGQESLTKECEYLDGKPCYYDGSGLQALKVFDLLVEKGSEAVWKELEDRYVSLFGALE